MSSPHPIRPRALAVVASAILATLLGGAIAPVAASAAPVVTKAAVADFTEKVNPFVSTEDDFGQDLPGAQAPNSIVKINPMTTPGRSHSGYDYAETKIAGFTHTNLDGVGGSGGGGDLLVVPTYTNYTARPGTDTYGKTYSHANEEATPGYYSVDLATTSGPIVAEATTDVRTGQDRFTFPTAGTASLVVDMKNNFTARNGGSMAVTKLADGRAALSGDFLGGFNGYNYQMYYYVETTVATTAVRTWGANGLGTGASQTGTDIGAILDFAVTDGQKVGLKVAISPISAAQAKVDLGAEMGDRTFAEVREDTAAAWNKILGTLDVTSTQKSDPDGSLTELFYTHLYRMFGSPVNATSTSGTYRGADGVVREATGYTHYDGWASWDDFRKYETLAVGYPDIYRDQMQSMVDVFVAAAASNKSLNSLTHSVPTVRYERAAVLIADAVSKGAKLKGLTQAWPALVSHSNGGYSNADNVRRGYIADSVDGTLGTAYDDWAMATIADSLGKTTEASDYRLRATNWTNLYKKDSVALADGSKTGLIFPKNSDGVFSSANPEQFESGGIYQGTLWQYNWYAADDMGGMIELMGGADKALKALSFMFGEQDLNDGKRMLHSNANEIDLQAPYLFNYVGAPSKTQYWARNIYTKSTWNRYIATGSTGELPSGGGELNPPIKTRVFSPTPQGFLPTMDNDAGTMSSTYVAAALGLFPVLAGSAEYQIGTPFFENVRISYPTGRTLDIKANGVSPDDYYVQSAKLNGESFDRTWVTYDQLTAGGELSFDMGNTASDWAADGVSSSSLSDVVPSTVYNPTSATALSGREFTESRQKDGSVDSTLSLTATNGTLAGVDGDDLAANGAITATGVPAGLTLSAKRAGAREVTLSLTGTATASSSLDSVDDVVITVKDAAFSKLPSTGAREFTTKVTFYGATLTAESTNLVAAKGGALDDSTVLTLGGAEFAGANGRDLVADGDLDLPGLPDSITASAVKKSATTAVLRLTGTLETPDADFTLAFADSALAAGHAAALTGDGVSGLSSFRIQVDAAWRAQLKDLYSDSRLVAKGSYSASTFATFTAALKSAKDVLANAKATDDDLQSAFTALRLAGSGLALKATSYRLLQAEGFDSWSGGELKTEGGSDLAGTGLTDVGGIRPGAWLAYSDLDFAGQLPKGLAIRYVNNSSRSAVDSAVEVRLDAPDGELVSTIPLPSIGNSWNHYTTVNYEFPSAAKFTGSHTVYFVYRGTTTDTNPWIVNMDSLQFLAAMPAVVVPPVTPAATVHLEAEAYTADNGGGLKREPGTDAAGKALTDVGGSWDGGLLTYETVDLGKDALTDLTVRYVNNSTRVAPNARLLVYLDEKTATPFATVPLPVTGNAWTAYATTKITLPTPVSGSHKIFVEMKATTNGTFPYVGNFDWFEFSPAPVVTPPVVATGLRVEAENFSSNSGGSLLTENGTDAAGVALRNVGGTYDNAELRYAVNLTEKSAKTISIRYVHNTGRSGTNARADVWLDTREGEPFASIPLPTTSANWNGYQVATAALPSNVSGSHTLIVALRAETTSALPFVANVDWFDLGYGANSSALRAAVSDAAVFVSHEARYTEIDYSVFETVLDEAKAAIASPASTDDVLAEALRRLNLATGQLGWKVIPQLKFLIEDAEAVTPETYTEESFAALTAALESAKAVPADASYSDMETAEADLSSAMDELETEAAPIITTSKTQVSLVEAGALTDAELIELFGAAIDKGDLVIDASAVKFDTAGTYPVIFTGSFRDIVAEPVTVTFVVTAPAVTPSVLHLSSATVTFGTAATLEATIAAGDEAVSGDLVLTVDGIDYTEAIADGAATFELPATLTAGTHAASVSYAGTKLIGASTATATVTVAKRVATLTVTTKGATFGKPSSVTVAVAVGSAAATGQVAVVVAGKSYPATLVKGKATVSLSSTLTAGTLAVSASYAGDATTASAVGTGKVVIAKATSKLSLKAKTSKPKVGKTHQVTITVTGVSKPTGVITISVAGKKVKTVSMSAASNGTVKVTLPKLKKKGTVTITAKYAGNVSIKASSASVKVKAKK